MYENNTAAIKIENEVLAICHPSSAKGGLAISTFLSL